MYNELLLIIHFVVDICVSGANIRIVNRPISVDSETHCYILPVDNNVRVLVSDTGTNSVNSSKPLLVFII